MPPPQTCRSSFILPYKKRMHAEKHTVAFSHVEKGHYFFTCAAAEGCCEWKRVCRLAHFLKAPHSTQLPCVRAFFIIVCEPSIDRFERIKTPLSYSKHPLFLSGSGTRSVRGKNPP